MKKLTIGCVAIAMAIAVCGCQTAKGPSDEEVLSKVTQECLATAKAQDIPKLMTYYSEKFSHPQLGDKAGLQNFLQSAKDMGYLENLEIDMSQSKTVITGATANVGPVVISGSFGSTNAMFDAAKENGVWKITSMDIDI